MTMQQFRIQIPGPGGGPGRAGGTGIVARLLLSMLAVVVLVSAAFLGAIFFLAALGLFIVGSLVLTVRIWWARRQIEKAMKQGDATHGGSRRPGSHDGKDVIEGEYLVVEETYRRAKSGDRDSGGDR